MSKFTRRGGQSPAAEITAAIIEKLEQGIRPWVKPWRGVAVSRPLRSCGTPYRGMNTFWLWMIAEAASTPSNLSSAGCPPVASTRPRISCAITTGITI